MKKRFIIAVIYLALMVPAVFLFATDLYPDEVALVNGKPISRAVLDRKVNEALMKLETEGQNPDKKMLEKNVLEGLINNELIYQESMRAGYKTADKMIETQYSAIKGQFGTEQQFLNTLEQRGYTEESLREELGRIIAIDNYIGGEVAPQVSVPEEEMLRYYEENIKIFFEPETLRASHILAGVEDPTDEGQKKAALRKIKEVEKKLKKREEFEALAKEYSDCPSSAAGGDLGYFQKGRMVAEFENAAFALEEGETSGIVETKFGYHIIKLVERKPERTVPFEEVKGDIEQWLGEQKIFEELKVLVDRLKKGAKIERYL
jgi:peptidyl-prolyl cis-trans isomerase C